MLTSKWCGCLFRVFTRQAPLNGVKLLECKQFVPCNMVVVLQLLDGVSTMHCIFVKSIETFVLVCRRLLLRMQLLA